MDLALWVSVLTTPRLCSRGWLLSKFKYWSVWVSFLNTLVRIVPSSLITDKVSNNARHRLTFFFISSTSTSWWTSPSVVHFMSSSIVFVSNTIQRWRHTEEGCRDSRKLCKLSKHFYPVIMVKNIFACDVILLCTTRDILLLCECKHRDLVTIAFCCHTNHDTARNDELCYYILPTTTVQYAEI